MSTGWKIPPLLFCTTAAGMITGNVPIRLAKGFCCGNLFIWDRGLMTEQLGTSSPKAYLSCKSNRSQWVLLKTDNSLSRPRYSPYVTN